MEGLEAWISTAPNADLCIANIICVSNQAVHEWPCLVSSLLMAQSLDIAARQDVQDACDAQERPFDLSASISCAPQNNVKIASLTLPLISCLF